MANFCRFCGSRLQEGQVCACQGAQAARPAYQAPQQPYQAPQQPYQAPQQPYQAPQQPYQAPQQPQAPVAPPAPKVSDPNSFGNKLIGLIKGYWSDAKGAAADVAASKAGLPIAGIFAGTNILILFFFLWRFVGTWVEASADSADLSTSKLIKLWDLEYPIFPMILAAIVIASTWIAVSAMITFVVAKIKKQEVNILQLFVEQAIHTMLPTGLLLVGILLSLIAWWMMLIVLGMIVVLWFVNVCTSACDAKEKGMGNLIGTGMIAGGLLVILLITSWMANWSIGCTTRDNYDDEKLSEYYEESDKGITHILVDALIAAD